MGMTDDLIHTPLRRAAQQFGDRTAIRAGEVDWTFSDLDRWSDAFAAHLVAIGIRRGDRVVVALTNRVEFVVIVNAISKVGGAAVLVSSSWKAAEVAHAVGLTSPTHAVADGASVEVLSHLIGPKAVTDVDGVDALPDPAQPSAVDPDGEALLVFSSGTTGMPKAVRHTHRSMGAAIASWIAALGLGPDDRFQVATPPSHILGLLNLLTAIEAGATVRLHARFDLDEVLRRIQSERMTLEMAVAPIALAMANHPNLEAYDLSSLRYIMWGATPVTESVARTVTSRTGIGFLPAYGASELPVISINPVSDPSKWRLDSAGIPALGVETRVVDLASGKPLEPGQSGEIEVRGPAMMAGYLPISADVDAFHDGWYRTGDVGWIEAEGWIHLTDRSKEMIKVSGFQVAPAEIEAVLHGHPAVLDCAVFGVPDERAGEVPVAAVQLDPNQSVPVQALTDLVSSSLASYKRLHDIVIVDQIPRLPSGKVLRRELREQWLARAALPSQQP